jgi:hypothetical protein
MIMSKLFLLLGWFVVAVYTFATTATLLAVLRHPKQIAIQPYWTQIAASGENLILGGVLGTNTLVEGSDARVAIVASFLERHNSPLEPYDYFGQFIVDTSDKYGVDYRLIPAIMMQESNLCKVIPPGSHNCLGFGIHSRGTLTFNSYEESIERATRELKSNYIDIGLTTPEKIMTKYTPGSNGSWADSVNQWIAEMEYNDRAIGRSLDQDANLLEYTSGY